MLIIKTKIKIENKQQNIKAHFSFLCQSSSTFYTPGSLIFVSWAVLKPGGMNITQIKTSKRKLERGHNTQTPVGVWLLKSTFLMFLVKWGSWLRVLTPYSKPLSVCFVHKNSLQTFFRNAAYAQVFLLQPGRHDLGEMILYRWQQKSETWDRDERWWMANRRWKMDGI